MKDREGLEKREQQKTWSFVKCGKYKYTLS